MNQLRAAMGQFRSARRHIEALASVLGVAVLLVLLAPSPGWSQTRCCQCSGGCFNPTSPNGFSCNDLGCGDFTPTLGTYVAAYLNEACPNSGVVGSYCPSAPQPPTPTPTVTPTPTSTPTPTATPTPQGLGLACINSTDCISTFCVDGVCCNGPCSNPGQSCNQPGRLGFCSPEGSPVPAASHRGLLGLTALLAALGVASLISVRYRRRSRAGS